jgi:hypothetical protein
MLYDFSTIFRFFVSAFALDVNLSFKFDLFRFMFFRFFPHVFRSLTDSFIIAGLYSLLDKEHVITRYLGIRIGTFNAEIAADADNIVNCH